MDAEEAYLNLCHRVGNDLLAAFDAACRQTGANYTIFAGTLLGSERGKGWIPWDDDVDVLMFREDYERLRATASRFLPRHMQLSDLQTDPSHRTSIPRLLHLGTSRRVSGRSRKRDSPETGHVVLDIFILDQAPAGKVRRALWRAHLRLLEKMIIAWEMRWQDALGNDSATAAQRMMELLGIVASRPIAPDRWRAAYLATCRRHSRSPEDVALYAVTNSIGPHRKLLFRKSDIQPTLPALFDGMEVSAPFDTNKVLTMMYGVDYMVPPPAERRKPLHMRNGLEAHIDGEYVDVWPDGTRPPATSG